MGAHVENPPPGKASSFPLYQMACNSVTLPTGHDHPNSLPISGLAAPAFGEHVDAYYADNVDKADLQFPHQSAPVFILDKEVASCYTLGEEDEHCFIMSLVHFDKF
jgi:hypothetical protein